MLLVGASSVAARGRRIVAVGTLDGGEVAPSLDAALLDDLMEGCQVIGRDFTYVYVNAAAASHGRATRASLIGRAMTDVYPGIDATPMFAALRRCMVERIPLEMENEFHFPDGATGWFELRLQPVPQGVFILSVDVTSRKRAEADLIKSREEYRALVENLEDVVYALDAGGRFTYVSPAVRRFGFAPEGLKGRHFTELLPPEDIAPAREIFAHALAEGHETRELRLVDKAGKVRHVRCSCRVAGEEGEARGVTGILYDISDQRSVEEQLRAAQRLESVGRLAGGIAHDFNNLLSVVLSYAGFALNALEAGDPLRNDLEEIRKAGLRAALLTRQLLAFSRKQVLQPEVLNLNRVLVGMENMLRRLIGEDVKLRIVPFGGLGNVKVDPAQIEQVVMNLAVNARDAMPGGGTLTIETTNVELDEEYARQHVAARPGPFVLLAVSDTGCGMNEATRARMFEPFFTTKESGKGTGLGLATVFGIVKQSGGNIWVYSEPGRGTTFKVYLPREFSAAESAAHRMSEPARSAGTETVLVVEDEESVRNAAKRILSAAGYTVLAASSGPDALEVAARHIGSIHLLLTDVIMPGMSGRDLASRLLSEYPELRVAYMSGYTDDTIAHLGVLEPGTCLVNKPFGAAELTRKVRQALDNGRNAP